MTMYPSPIFNSLNFVGIPGNALTTVRIGDSITANCGIPPASTGQDWFQWGNSIAGSPFVTLANLGVVGALTAAILSQISPALAYLPTCVEIMAGTNDVSTGVPYATTIANLQSMYQQCINAGVYVRAYAILPRNNLSNAGQLGQIIAINQWIKEFWHYNRGGEYIDVFSSLINPSSTTYTSAANSSYFYDSVLHPNQLGAYLMGVTIAPYLQKWSIAQILPSSSFDDAIVSSGSSPNLAANPLMLGTGGSSGTGITGTVPNGCSVTGAASVTGVCSTPARSDGFGNNWQHVITATAAGLYSISGPAVVTPSNLIVGKKYYLDFNLNVSPNPTGLNTLQAAINFQGGSTNPGWIFQNNDNAVFSFPTGINLTCRTPAATYLGGASQVFPLFYWNFTGAASVTMSIGRMGVYQALQSQEA